MVEALEHPATGEVMSETSDDRIGICFMIDRLLLAGTETQVLRLIENLDRTRFRPCLALLDGTSDRSQSLEPDNCPSIRLGVKKIKSSHGARAAIRLATFLRENRVEILQVYFPDSTFLGMAAGRIAGVTHYIRNRRNLGYKLSKFEMFLGRLYSKTSLLTAANSEACRAAVIEQEAAKPESVIVIPNGVDLNSYVAVEHPRKDLAGQSAPVIGMVANLRPVKDPKTLVTAAIELQKEFPDLQLKIAGEGELRSELTQQIADAGLQKQLRLIGQTDDVPEFLQSLDVAVLSSTSEGLSNSVIEYMGAARPIVATRVGGNAELIESEKSGLLVAPGNVEQMVNCIRKMLVDREFAVRCGLAARERALANYSLQRQTERFESLWSEMARS